MHQSFELSDNDDDRKMKKEQDQSQSPSSDFSLANDSGFCESLHFHDDSGNHGNWLKQEPTDTVYQRGSTASGGFKNRHDLLPYSFPRSSSPNRVEIFIDENWSRVKKEDFENAATDNDWSKTEDVRSDSYTEENTGNVRAIAIYPLHDSTGFRNVRRKRIKKESVEDYSIKSCETGVNFPVFTIKKEGKSTYNASVLTEMFEQNENIPRASNVRQFYVNKEDHKEESDYKYFNSLQSLTDRDIGLHTLLTETLDDGLSNGSCKINSEEEKRDEVTLCIKTEPPEELLSSVESPHSIEEKQEIDGVCTNTIDISHIKKELIRKHPSTLVAHDRCVSAKLPQGENALSEHGEWTFSTPSEVGEHSTDVHLEQTDNKVINNEVDHQPALTPEKVSEITAAEKNGNHLESKTPAKQQIKYKKGCRKPSKPKRSPTKIDPRFKGATIWLQTEYKDGKSRLNISAFYSNVKVIYPDLPRQSLFGRHMLASSPDSYSYSDTEDNSTPPYSRETFIIAKACASCRTRRTPLWRDAEDGTPLCNACGIRYKKYRLRCSRCWHIPKKDIKTYPNCPACGAALRYSFSRRTW